MLEKVLNLNGVTELKKSEQKTISGGTDKVWTVTCKNGNQYCPNPTIPWTQQAIVDICKNDGGFKRQTRELSAS
ncbi:hypothetical protein [Flavobacterium microcysteis]|uniref:Uncharacterized protein n=1 Tax=Flavobacterium microcysteis TaxID=2596891 RepID=A0A501QFY6_9FLAO|nr:hypothetical protein [Flavobacterium microcysteis]TPD71304.1 hypothetical protein FJA49_05230 [Flavobacterium microcysteis]